MEVIRSISFDQDEIIDNILKLHCDGPIELDPTYSKGNFYKKRERPKYCFDIAPQFNFVEQADCRNLPLPGKSIRTAILDLPFGIGSGPSLLQKKKGQNITPGRFSCLPTGKALFELYEGAIKEIARILVTGGVLILKSQPVVACGKQWPTHFRSFQYAESNGLVYTDEFVLLAKQRPISGKIKKQRNARKFHSFFFVFRKKKL